MVFSQVVTFYKRADIPLITEIKAYQKAIILLNENSKLRAIPIAQ